MSRQIFSKPKAPIINTKRGVRGKMENCPFLKDFCAWKIKSYMSWLKAIDSISRLIAAGWCGKWIDLSRKKMNTGHISHICAITW